jgi:transposase
MARSRTLSARSVLRAKIVLHRASGESFRDLGQALGCAHRTAWQCLKRWEEAGFGGLERERPGRGQKSWVIALKGQEVLQKTTQEQPVNATHWSRASMAQATGVPAQRFPFLAACTDR